LVQLTSILSLPRLIAEKRGSVSCAAAPKEININRANRSNFFKYMFNTAFTVRNLAAKIRAQAIKNPRTRPLKVKT
jgi:hypothetical protein